MSTWNLADLIAIARDNADCADAPPIPAAQHYAARDATAEQWESAAGMADDPAVAARLRVWAGAKAARVAVWFAVGDITAHEGHVTSEWADVEWTYQEITGAHGRVLYEGPSEDAARAELAAFLTCDAPAKGTYCYAHNPRPE